MIKKYIEQKFFNALQWIVKILEKHSIPYTISGGFAAHLYDAKRELNDIDIDIQDKAFDIILDDIKDYLVFGPSRYKDAKWDLKLATLNYHGIEIDLGGSDACSIYNDDKKEWIKSPVDFSKAFKFDVNGL